MSDDQQGWSAPLDAVPSDGGSCARDLASGVPVGELVRTPAERLDRALMRCSERELEIFRLRVFADTPLTLEELGTRLGLTRERVRQIASRETRRLQAAECLQEILAISSQALRGDSVTPLKEILDNLPWLSDAVPQVGQPLWRVLDRLSDSFEVKDGWWCLDSCKSAIAKTKRMVINAAGDEHAVRLSELAMWGDRQWAEEWLKYCGVSVHEGHALLKPGIPDRAAVSLCVAGSPLSSEQIASRIGPEVALTSVKNALGADERFARVDRNTWALSSWRLSSYRSIRQLISEEIAANEGAVRLTKLVESLTSRFSISAKSVAGYANASPFATIDGIVAMSESPPSAPRKSPFSTRRLFRVRDRWMLRTVITQDHVRGSGSALPNALISLLGLRFGEPTYLTSRLGDQRIGWSGPQATLGSIKRIVDADGFAVGDLCFLVFTDAAEFDIVKLDLSSGAGHARAYKLAGLEAIDAHRSDLLAHAIGLPIRSTWAQLAQRLRERGDYDVADLIEERPIREGGLRQ